MKTSLKPLEYPNAAAVRARLHIVLDGLGDECETALRTVVSSKATHDDVLEELDYVSADMEEMVELIAELKQHLVIAKEAHPISSEREDSNLQ